MVISQKMMKHRVCFRKEQALEDAAKLSEAASDDPKSASVSAEPVGVSHMFKNCGANPLRKGGLTRFDQVFGNTQSTPLRIITARERKLQVRAVANQMLQMQRAKKAENR